MKRTKIISLLFLAIAILCASLFTACSKADNGGTSSSSSSSIVGDSSSSSSSPDSSWGDHPHEYVKTEGADGSTFTYACFCGDVEKGYRIQFIYQEDGSPADEGIEVSWIDENGDKFTAVTDEFGYVEVLTLPNQSYKVEVNEDTLPEIDGIPYSFDGSKFQNQSNGTGFVISLIAYFQPLNANETGITGRPFVSDNTSDRYLIELDKTYMATLNGPNDDIWYDVQHNGFGDYTVDASLTSGLNVIIEKYNASMAYIPGSPDPNVDKTEKNKMTYIVGQPYANSQSTFRFTVTDAASYPVNVLFKVSITYQPDANGVAETFIRPNHFDTVDAIYTYYTVGKDENGATVTIANEVPSLMPASNVSKHNDVEGATIKNMTESELSAMELRTDGYYYTNGQLVYAKIDAPSILQSSTLASIVEDSAAFGEGVDFGLYHITKQDAYGCYVRNDNYFGFVQAYAALCNKDGLYPLTSELKEYLERVVEKESAANLTRHLYEMLCTYQIQVKDFAYGDGSRANPYVLNLSEQSLGSYKLSLSASGNLYVKLSGTMDVVLSFNSNVNATYSVSYDEYLAVDGDVIASFESKDGTAFDFYLNVSKYDNPSVFEIGENFATAQPTTPLIYEFKAPGAGSYTVSVSTEDVSITVFDENENDIGNEEMTFVLAENQSVYFIVTTTFETSVEFFITIEQVIENE